MTTAEAETVDASVALLIERFQAILRDVEYRDYRFVVGYRRGGYYLRLAFAAIDHDKPGGEVEEMTGRKWLLSPKMTRSEVVLTAFKAVMTAEEHEIREQFKLRGVAVLGPHFDLYDLAAQIRSGEIDADVRATA